MLTSWDDGMIASDRRIDPGACLDAARDALIALDAAGDVIVWSAGAERIYGWPADEVIGRPLPWSEDGRRGAEHVELHDLARRGVIVGIVPIETSRRNGSSIVTEVSIDPVRDAEGRIIGTCSIHRDIGPRVTAERTAPDAVDIDLTVEPVADPDEVGFDGLCDHYGLSTFERDLVALLLTGHRIPAIARTLGRSPGTIRNRLSVLYRTFGVRGQIELLELLHEQLGTACAASNVA